MENHLCLLLQSSRRPPAPLLNIALFIFGLNLQVFHTCASPTAGQEQGEIGKKS